MQQSLTHGVFIMYLSCIYHVFTCKFEYLFLYEVVYFYNVCFLRYNLPASSQQLLFHSAVFLDHLMVVFGGSQLGNDRLCFSNEVLTYDTGL